MSDLNSLFLQGRLTKNASMNTLSNGSCVVTLSLAVNKDYLDRSTNEWKKITNFFDVDYWGDSAKNKFSEFTKGREVLVEAELKNVSWEKDGKKYSRIEIRASCIRPLRRPGEGKKINSNDGQSEMTQNYGNTAPEAPNFEEMPYQELDENNIPY